MKLQSLLALAATALATAAHAQTTMPPAKAPKGELSTPNQDKGARPAGASTESRGEVKSDAKAARAAASAPKGEQSTATQGSKPAPAMGSDTTRGEVKSDAAAANKAGENPKGQESVKGQAKGGMQGTKP